MLETPAGTGNTRLPLLSSRRMSRWYRIMMAMLETANRGEVLPIPLVFAVRWEDADSDWRWDSNPGFIGTPAFYTRGGTAAKSRRCSGDPLRRWPRAPRSGCDTDLRLGVKEALSAAIKGPGDMRYRGLTQDDAHIVTSLTFVHSNLTIFSLLDVDWRLDFWGREYPRVGKQSGASFLLIY